MQPPKPFELGALVWVPDDEDIANPATVAKNEFCPGERGCVVFDDDEGTELELTPQVESTYLCTFALLLDYSGS